MFDQNVDQNIDQNFSQLTLRNCFEKKMPWDDNLYIFLLWNKRWKIFGVTRLNLFNPGKEEMDNFSYQKRDSWLQDKIVFLWKKRMVRIVLERRTWDYSKKQMERRAWDYGENTNQFISVLIHNLVTSWHTRTTTTTTTTTQTRDTHRQQQQLRLVTHTNKTPRTKTFNVTHTDIHFSWLHRQPPPHHFTSLAFSSKITDLTLPLLHHFTSLSCLRHTRSPALQER